MVLNRTKAKLVWREIVGSTQRRRWYSSRDAVRKMLPRSRGGLLLSIVRTERSSPSCPSTFRPPPANPIHCLRHNPSLVHSRLIDCWEGSGLCMLFRSPAGLLLFALAVIHAKTRRMARTKGQDDTRYTQANVAKIRMVPRNKAYPHRAPGDHQ